MNKFEIINNPTYGMTFSREKFSTPEVQSEVYRGHNIDIIFDPAYKETKDGYVCHKIVLANEDICAGCLKVFYLPQENKEKYFPDIAYYLSAKGHSYGLSKIPKRVEVFPDSYNSWENKDREQKTRTLERIYMSISYGLYSEFNSRENKDSIDLDDEYRRVIKLMLRNRELSQKFKHINYYLDKPTIEFSSIRGAKGDVFQFGNIEDNFAVQKYLSERNISIERFTREDRGIDLQGIGLGKLMYKYMADWMALNNMRLHKGGTNEYSTPLWETSFKNDSRFNLVEENGKKFIDHRGMDLSYLQKPNASKKQKNKLNQI